MDEIIGRKKEISELKKLYASRKAEFVAIYGRRRVGKTFITTYGLAHNEYSREFVHVVTINELFEP